MMEIKEMKIAGVFIISSNISKDDRGSFYKTYHYEIFQNHGLNNIFKESYYSISKKNVIRGMHFQVPPFDHDKLVYVPRGSIIDVVLDIRKESNTYGEFFEIELSGENKKVIYIPRGCAHGFKALEDESLVIYMQNTIYNEEYDKGIRYNSFGYNWNCQNPILSTRDESFITIDKFESPF